MNHKLFVIQIHSFDSIKLEEYFKDMGHVNAPQKSMLESDSELVILNSIDIFSFLCVKTFFKSILHWYALWRQRRTFRIGFRIICICTALQLPVMNSMIQIKWNNYSLISLCSLLTRQHSSPYSSGSGPVTKAMFSLSTFSG